MIRKEYPLLSSIIYLKDGQTWQDNMTHFIRHNPGPSLVIFQVILSLQAKLVE